MDPVAPRVTRAAVWTADGIELRRVAVPDLEPGDTLVKVRLATVCGSDLHTVSGRRPGPCPSVLGHEAVGDAIAGPMAGRRVVWSVTVSCGRCARCAGGRTAKCTSVRKVGHESFDGDWPLSGGYADHIVLPAGATIVIVPESIPDRVAAPAACATATVMATLEAAGPVAGRRVLICGAGMLGVAAAAACDEAGADVRVADIDPGRRELAGRFGGAADAGGQIDVAIDFSGASTAVSAALGRLDVGGVLVLAGSVLPAPAVDVDPERVVRQWLTITGVHNYEPRHLEQAVRFLERTRGRYPWAEVVADPVGLDRLSTVLTPAPPGILRASVAP
ncbi:zinc-binding dehydrogenase [Mycobacterium sp. CPCC 205372]|uniref:alcohol dehydrogenase n=1 Tax=Mycobacterium hippophais TaxID=3016340 RepID=A0ABT4Q172_9MYCO|nr:zinc-binding dehydrogenase [Mycobacterium hippophais]MCZ8382476.1 zinc-binding dehydrogenase [Mycobacterium hippophais]